MPQSGSGVVEYFEDFLGAEVPLLNTNLTDKIGSLRIIGEGVSETDCGVTVLESDGLGGVAQFQTTNEADHDIGFCTAKTFDVALMGPIVLEARVRFADLDTKSFFFGLCDVNEDDAELEADIISGSTTTITLTASDLVGFFWDSELTDDEDWHTVYNGGTTTGVTASGNIDVDDDAVAGEFQILRLEVAPNGTAYWYIDEVQVGGSAGARANGVSGAVSTTVDLAVLCMVNAKGAAVETFDIDYVKIVANRDFTV